MYPRIETELQRLRRTVNDQANTITQLQHEIDRLQKAIANQYLAFQAETKRLLEDRIS